MTDIDLDAIDAERARIRDAYLHPAESRPDSSARGLHHFAVVARGRTATISGAPSSVAGSPRSRSTRPRS